MKLNWDNGVSAEYLHSAWCTVAAGSWSSVCGQPELSWDWSVQWGYCSLPGISSQVLTVTLKIPSWVHWEVLVRALLRTLFPDVCSILTPGASCQLHSHVAVRSQRGTCVTFGEWLITVSSHQWFQTWSLGPRNSQRKTWLCEQISRTCVYLYCWDFLAKPLFCLCVMCMPVNSIIYK